MSCLLTLANVNRSSKMMVPPLKRLERWWTQGMPLTEREAAVGVPAASTSLSSAQWTAPICVAIPIAIVAVWELFVPVPSNWLLVAEAFATWGALTGLSMTILPRRAIRRLYRKPLLPFEIKALLPGAHNDIDRAYLALLRDAIGRQCRLDTEAGMRDALRSLGRAADSLPSQVPPPQNTEALRQQAADVLAHARLEKDTVAAASLARQADALARQAAASDRSALVTHRAHVLREEVLAQIEALRAGLTDFHTDAAPDTALLAALSENARRAADEASNVAQARAELDAYVAAPDPQSAVAAPATLKAGHE